MMNVSVTVISVASIFNPSLSMTLPIGLHYYETLYKRLFTVQKVPGIY